MMQNDAHQQRYSLAPCAAASVFFFDAWHRQGRPHLLGAWWEGSGTFEPLLDSESDVSETAAPSVVTPGRADAGLMSS
jgi:hypothetical protein